MSLSPFFLEHDPWELRQYHPRRRFHSHAPWDNFGLGISPADIQLLAAIPSLFANEKNQLSKVGAGSPQPVVGKEGFQVHMDVQQFKPSEIIVKTVNDFVVVEGKHEDRQDDHGYISRHFVRKYKLPKGYDANQVASSLSSDGVLTIKAPPPTKSIEGKEKIVQIQQVGPAHLNIKENQTEEKAEKPNAEKTKK